MTATTAHLGAHPARRRHRAPRAPQLRRRIAEAGLALGLLMAAGLGALHATAAPHPAMDSDPAPAAVAAP